MRNQKSVRVIFDTNIWISFLIGKRLGFIKDYIADKRIKIIFTQTLLDEIKLVTLHPKFSKYFPEEKVDELIKLLKTVGENINIKPKNYFSKDPKDSFLLDLIEFSKADYLVTGDYDLIELEKFKTAKFVSAANFEKELKQ